MMMTFYSIFSDRPEAVLSLFVSMIVIFLALIIVARRVRDMWILRRNARRNHNNSQIPKMQMMEVHIPFTFKLQELSPTDGIHCMVSSQDCYKFMAFWGVSIRELHALLWQPWPDMLSAIQRDCFLCESYQHLGMDIRNASHDEKVVSLPLPLESLDLGMPPRTSYPLVIFLITDHVVSPKPEETVALINIIHIKDPVCTLPTSILAQYLKQASGQLSCLKQLYLAGDDAETIQYENDTNFDMERPSQLCVVCQHFPVSRALLPCRHTCVCGSCFNKLKTCPLCRSPIRSYFCIRSEDYLTESERVSTQQRSFFWKIRAFMEELLEGEDRFH